MANKINYININTVCDDIDNVINDVLTELNIDAYDYKAITSIKHSTVNYMLSTVYKRLFKPDHNLPNNQKSLVDYNDIELLQVLANKFIDICQRFNKSLGLMSFSYMLGCSYSTLDNWLHAADSDELNRARLEVLKSIQVSHKAQHIALLNDSPVGALAVANNDFETGLEWSKNQLQQITTKEVYYLPATRADKLGLEKLENEL